MSFRCRYIALVLSLVIAGPCPARASPGPETEADNETEAGTRLMGRVIDRPLVRDRGIEGSLVLRLPLAAEDDSVFDFVYLDIHGRFGTRRLEVFGSIGLALARADAADVIDRGTVGVRVAAGSRGALRLGAFFLQPTETTEPSRFALQTAFELRRPLHSQVALLADGGLEFVNRIWGDEVPEPAQTWWSLSAFAAGRLQWQATDAVAFDASVGVQVPLAANPGEGEPDEVLGARYEVNTAVVGSVGAVVQLASTLDAFARLARTAGRSDFSLQSQTETLTATIGVSARW